MNPSVLKYFFLNENKVQENTKKESLSRHATCLAYFRDQKILVEYTHTRLNNQPTEGDVLCGASLDIIYIRYESGYDNPLAWLSKVDDEDKPHLESMLAEMGMTVDEIKDIYQIECKKSSSRCEYKAFKKREIRYAMARHLRARDPRCG